MEYSWFIMITHDASWVHPGIQEHPGSPGRNHKNIQGTLARPPMTFCQCATVIVLRVFEGHIHQVPCLCSQEPQTTWGIFLAMDRVLFISVLEPYMLKTCLGNKASIISRPREPGLEICRPLPRPPWKIHGKTKKQKEAILSTKKKSKIRSILNINWLYS